MTTLSEIPDNFDQIKHTLAKIRCEEEHLYFTRYMFRARTNLQFKVNWHHHLEADTVDGIISGRLKNVVFNVSPGSSKTEMFVVNFIARGLAKNPWSRFLHLSASDLLVTTNSGLAREIVTSDEYQAFWPMKIADDAKSKKRWNVMVGDKIAGGVYATAVGGQVTGFRAGHMAPGFHGAILIDDPIKPDDIYSKSKVDAANRKLVTTVQTRRANPDTPIVVIMQRVSDDDCTAFIKDGNLPGEWTFIKIPALIDDAYVSTLDPIYQKLVDSSVRDEHGRFSYWEYKEPLKTLLKMESGNGETSTGNRVTRHVFNSQYQQAPTAIGGNIIKGHYFPRYKVLPKIRFRKIYADTAQKTKEHNDYSVFEEWGYGDDGKIYLIDMIRGKWESPELKRQAIAFWTKCKARDQDASGALRNMMVEDKSSGTALIQDLKAMNSIPVKGIERHIDRYTRIMNALPYIEQGMVCVPEDAPFASEFISEHESYSPEDTHDHDDQIDPMTDAVDDMLSTNSKLRAWETLAHD